MTFRVVVAESGETALHKALASLKHAVESGELQFTNLLPGSVVLMVKPDSFKALPVQADTPPEHTDGGDTKSGQCSNCYTTSLILTSIPSFYGCSYYTTFVVNYR